MAPRQMGGQPWQETDNRRLNTGGRQGNRNKSPQHEQPKGKPIETQTNNIDIDWGKGAGINAGDKMRGTKNKCFTRRGSSIDWKWETGEQMDPGARGNSDDKRSMRRFKKY